MVKDSKKALVPKLRFPEFRNAGSWDQRTLNELLRERKQRNRDLKYGPGEVLSVSGDHGCVNQIELLGRSYAGVSVKEYHVIETGDIVYTKSPLKRNPYGIIKENKGKPGIVSTLYAVYHATELGHPAYLDHYFSRDYNLNSYLQPIVRKGAKNDMKVNNAAVLTGEVLAPKIAEQRKIAECLSSLDALIAAQGRKVEALKTYKRGLMQRLFPREGETLPRLRFPEFRDAAEWKSEQLDALAKRGSGHTPNKSIADYYNGGVKWISLADSKRLDKGLISQTSIEISQQGLDNSSAVLHPAGSVVLSRDAGVGKSAVMGMPMAVSQHFMVWTCHENRMSNWFLYYVLQKMKAIFESIATGSTIKTIGVPFFRDMAVMLPAFPEQQKIAELLFALDSRVTAESEKLTALKTHKMGLMQQLFPSPEEA